ncbi:MAG: helix-turn-helix domain-containing protein [Candidatus Sumerlaeota bacterium]|nr:helix-turn-helix domain-containing protein [Candidatus Sumerlaeota bacterium]
MGELLDTKQAARVLNLCPGTLELWRVYKRGPSFVRLGRAVRYLPDELERFVKAGTQATSESPAGG